MRAAAQYLSQNTGFLTQPPNYYPSFSREGEQQGGDREGNPAPSSALSGVPKLPITLM